MNPRHLSLAVLCAATAHAPCQDAQPASHRITVTDGTITDAILRELQLDAAIPAYRIDVAFEDGVATLSGDVDNALARDRSARIAETVKGVRSVINRIRVTRSGKSDEALRDEVIAALRDDPATDSYEIDVAVRNGVVTLTGTVDSWAEKNLGETVAKGVRGVVDVTNNTKFRFAIDRSDAEIDAEIEQCLRWDYLVDDELIEVEVNDGRVALTGTVGSAAEKSRARVDAWTAGVTAVDVDGLVVDRWERDHDLRKTKYAVKTSDEIRDAVLKALIRDPRVFSFNLDVKVSAGTVSLYGVVDNLKAKRAAEQDARHTVGVHSVRNHVRVRPNGERTDGDVESSVEATLRRDPYVDRYQLGVAVHGGTAYLSGNVDSYFEKSRADDLAARVNGIVSVVNNITVSNPRPIAYDPWVDSWGDYRYPSLAHQPLTTTRSDRLIADDIRDELWWSPYVDSDRITVSVQDGAATLTGTVDSWPEWRAAWANAYDGGAVMVHNRLEVADQ